MNKDILVKGLTFLTGGVIGSLVTWKLVKTKYEKLAEEEIESVREYYAGKKDISSENGSQSADDNDKVDEMSISEIRKRVQELGEENEKIMKEKEDEETVDIKIIPPEESWEQDYPVISLTYYEGDGVLADPSNKEIKNISDLVPNDFADHFGEYEDDSVFVRNDRLKVYYEILRDFDRFSEI